MADTNTEAEFLASMSNQQYNQAPFQQDSDDDQVEQDENDEDEDDYDPQSFLPEPSGLSKTATPQIPLSSAQQGFRPSPQDQSRPGSTMSSTAMPAAQRPATVGGFIAEDSEDEGNTSQAADAQGSVNVASVKSPSQAPPGSVSQTPVSLNAQMYNLPTSAADISDIAASTAQESVASQVVPNGGAAPPFNPTNDSHDGDSGSKTGEVASIPIAQGASQAKGPSSSVSLPKARLPHDIVGQLEDRIKEDPKGDIDAWLGAIAHFRSKGKLEEARKIYTRFFEMFPTAADQWVSYARMEQEIDDLPKLEGIFQTALMKVQSIPLWSIYLDHVRRRNDILTDTSGQGRQTVSQAYEFVLTQVGHDKDSGKIWQDYIGFIKSGPGNAGGTGWQDAQKMDLLRKAYQRAICVPMEAVSALWKEYDQFEMGLNKMTGRKFLQEKSPSYMTARSSFTALQNITLGIQRGGVPRLPPLPGHAGDDEFGNQVDIWLKWLAWEKEDPLVLKDEDLEAYRMRILFVYKQACMALRFWPDIWYEAAVWCFDNGREADGTDFLAQGQEANPESCLLAFKRADRIEQTMQVEEGDDGAKRKGDAVREPYDIVLNALYALIDKVKAREPYALARVEEQFAQMAPESRDATPEADDDNNGNDDDRVDLTKPMSRSAQKAKMIEAVQNGTKAHMRIISKTVTYVWIALMRAYRRIQGKGKPGEKLGGMRQIFTDARKRGRLLSDMYSASALMEHHCYHDPAASKIFERGMKLFPDDESFALEYIKHLLASGDTTNARSVFETTVSKITAKPGDAGRAKPLYLFFHDWESQYGDLAQVISIEKRMGELYPEDRSAMRFAQRYSPNSLALPVFNPCDVRLVLSPTQIKPKTLATNSIPSVETVPAVAPPIEYTQSPKRPLDDSDVEQPQRKFLRGESPLKGAAGRRQQQRQAREGLGSNLAAVAPKPLPPQIHALLSIIPPARQWQETRFEPQKMTELIKSINLSTARVPGNVGAGYGYNYGN